MAAEHLDAVLHQLFRLECALEEMTILVREVARLMAALNLEASHRQQQYGLGRAGMRTTREERP